MNIQLLIPCIAFSCELIDSTLGGGFGTILSPVLIIMEYTPIQIVPCILMSEIITGITGGILHHHQGNVNFHDNAIRRLTLGLVSCAVIGTVIAVICNTRLPKQLVSQYIGILVLSLGILVLRTRSISFSRSKIMIIGLIAAFNKGISGGGYGPVVCSGNIISGVKVKDSIAVTSLAEGIVCLVGLFTYWLLQKHIDWQLLFPILIGSILAPFISVKMVNKIPVQGLTKLIGLLYIVLGIVTLLKISQP